MNITYTYTVYWSSVIGRLLQDINQKHLLYMIMDRDALQVRRQVKIIKANIHPSRLSECGQ